MNEAASRNLRGDIDVPSTLAMSAHAPPQKATARQEFTALWKLALPLAAAQAGQALMGLIDTAVVGRLSATAQGGAGLGSSLFATIFFLGLGTLMGLDPLISQAIGASDPRRARSLYWSGVWLAGIVSVFLMALMLLVPSILLPFGVEPAIARGATEFLFWRIPGLPAALLFVATRSYLEAVGRVQAMFWSTLIANVANFALDIVLVFGLGPIPPLGIAGAALASTLCSWLQFAILAYALGPSVPGVVRRFDAAAFKRASKVGLPIGLHLIAEAGIFTLTGLFAGRLGESAIAAHQIALSWASVSFCFALGVGSAASVRVGWGIGRRDTPAARRAGFMAFASGVTFMTLSALIFVLLPQQLARLMSSNSEVIAVTSALFWVAAIFQVSDGTQAIGAGVLRGIGDTKFVFWANILGHWLVGLPIAYWLGVKGPYGVVGLWWGLSAGLTLVGGCLLIRFARLSRREIVPLEQGH